MNVPLLDLVAQYDAIKGEVLPAVQAVIESQQFVMGPAVSRLETALAQLARAKHGIACASGTDALLLPLKALGLKPGDEVITTPFTFFATAGTIHNAGGTPVFVDIEPDTFNIDPAGVEAAITRRTRAIMPVHLYGQMAAMERLDAIARTHGLPIIEDAAQAIGARRRIGGQWRVAGEMGWASGFSFFPSKNLGGWGDGGLIVTSDDALAARLSKLRLHGGAKQYYHDEVGTNSRLDTLQAAVLLAKLPHLSAWSAKRREHADYYTRAFAVTPGGRGALRPPPVDPANEHIYHQYTVRAERRDELQAHLKAQGIGSAIYYPLPLHLQPCFKHLGYQAGQFPESERASREALSLPVYPELTRAQLDCVIETIRGFYR
ncbi:MAG: transcriptional regulator [Gemmatimonadetes bacterium]|nr:MAG: transcriptional regulator [Gemmatimonadota bacterium]PYP97953.1 MAG: transcriptional regulator [Gemmatimonadota bacterium]